MTYAEENQKYLDSEDERIYDKLLECQKVLQEIVDICHKVEFGKEYPDNGFPSAEKAIEMIERIIPEEAGAVSKGWP